MVLALSNLAFQQARPSRGDAETQAVRLVRTNQSELRQSGVNHLLFGCGPVEDGNGEKAAVPERPPLSPEEVKAVLTNPEVFDSNQLVYDPTGIYSADGTLTLPQKVCDFLIRKVYQGPTRSTIYKWLGNPCPYKRKAKRLSCSEFTLVMIHRLGVVRGIWEGAKRLIRCNPVTVMRNNYDDPVIRFNQLPWKYLPAL